MGIFVEVTCTLQSTARQWLHAAKQSLMRNNVKMFVTFNPSAARVFSTRHKIDIIIEYCFAYIRSVQKGYGLEVSCDSHRNIAHAFLALDVVRSLKRLQTRFLQRLNPSFSPMKSRF